MEKRKNSLHVTPVCFHAFNTLKIHMKHSILSLNLNAFSGAAMIELASDRYHPFKYC